VSVQPEQAWLVHALEDDWQEMRAVAIEYSYMPFASESAFRRFVEVLPKFYGIYFVKHVLNSTYHIAEIGPGFDENTEAELLGVCSHDSLLHKLRWRNRLVRPQPLAQLLTSSVSVNDLIEEVSQNRILGDVLVRWHLAISIRPIGLLSVAAANMAGVTSIAEGEQMS
jgi:hypothetical protein